MTAEAYKQWEFRIEQVTKSRNPKFAAAAFIILYQSPGFAGIRSQVGQLVKHWRGFGSGSSDLTSHFLRRGFCIT